MAQATLSTEWSGYFTKGQWHYARSSFGAAGQDSFTVPPNQNEDLFELLQNTLPPLTGTLQRRWGYSLLNLNSGPLAFTPSAAVPASLYYNFVTNTRSVIFPDGFNAVHVYNEDGSTLLNNLATFIGSPVRSVCSRSFQYFATGNQADLQKWDGTVNTTRMTNWGIFAPGLSTAPLSNTSSTLTQATPGPSASTWFITGGAASTTFTEPSKIGSAQLIATNFGFALPAASSIQGIQIQITASVQASSGANPRIIGNISRNGTVTTGGVSQTLGVNHLDILPVVYTFGAANSLWGQSWSPSDINNTNFGVTFEAINSSGAGSVAVDVTSIQINLMATEPIVISGTTGGGAITLISGRIYTAVFTNSNTTHTSDVQAFSQSTGPVTNVSVNLTNIPVSTDPQVSNVEILATSDGGDETLLYYLASLPNGTTAYTDTTPDTALVLNNVYAEQDIYGDEIGVFDNTPPPANLLYPLAHRGRIYGAAGPLLYYSKAESELLTTTGFLAGKFEECWPGLNYFTITSQADVITGLLSDGQVLYVGTTRQVVRLFGDGPSDFTLPEALFQDVGVLNQDVWRMVFMEGNPVGCMWLTPDYRVIGSDFNTYVDVGRPIQNVLSSINPAAAQTAWSGYVGEGIYNLYLLAIPTGTATSPNTLMVFDLKLRNWHSWVLPNTIIGGIYNITQTGAPIFYFADQSGVLYKLDPTVTQDRVGNTPVNIPVVARTSWLTFQTDPSGRKYLNEIEIGTGDPSMTLTVEGASTAAEWNGAPNLVVANAPLVTKPLGELAVFLAGYPARDRYYRYTFSSAGTIQTTDFLRLASIEGGILHRV